jgi:hypothetical protein
MIIMWKMLWTHTWRLIMGLRSPESLGKELTAKYGFGKYTFLLSVAGNYYSDVDFEEDVVAESFPAKDYVIEVVLTSQLESYFSLSFDVDLDYFDRNMVESLHAHVEEILGDEGSGLLSPSPFVRDYWRNR